MSFLKGTDINFDAVVSDLREYSDNLIDRKPGKEDVRDNSEVYRENEMILNFDSDPNYQKTTMNNALKTINGLFEEIKEPIDRKEDGQKKEVENNIKYQENLKLNENP